MGNAEACGNCGGEDGERGEPVEMNHRPVSPLKPAAADEAEPCQTYFPSGISTRIMHDHEKGCCFRPLHWAAQAGDLALAEHLLRGSTGAEPSAGSSVGLQPLHLSAEAGHVRLAEHLARRGVEVNSANARGIRPLHLAARGGHL